jgi:hypothetical protein
LKNLLLAIGRFFRPSAFHYVVLISSTVVLATFFGRYYLGGGGLDVRLRDRRARPEERARAADVISDRIYYGDDSARERYSERLRDASQLAVALGLYTVRERTGSNRVLPNIEAVVDGLQKSPLMPPGFTAERVVKFAGGRDPRGEFVTATGAYYVTYRARPLAFEILAAGERGAADGAVFVVRFPDPAGTIQTAAQSPPAPGSFATVFVAPERNAVVPAPFSPADVYRAAGWGQEPLHATPVTPAEAAEISRFLADVSGKQ